MTEEQELQKTPVPNVKPSSINQNVDMFRGPTRTNVRPAKKLSPIEQIQKSDAEALLAKQITQNRTQIQHFEGS